METLKKILDQKEESTRVVTANRMLATAELTILSNVQTATIGGMKNVPTLEKPKLETFMKTGYATIVKTAVEDPERITEEITTPNANITKGKTSEIRKK